MRGQRRPGDPRAGRRQAPAGTPTAVRRTPDFKPGEPVEVGPPVRTYRGHASTRFTGRAAVLFLVVTALALTLAWPARQYVDQRRQIASLREQTRATQARVALLRQQQQQWNDPQFIAAQARQRLHFRLPGEQAYIVLRSTPQAKAVPQPLTTAPKQAWYTSLWDSVDKASTKS